MITWRHLNIYSYCATFTVLYGMRCSPEFVSGPDPYNISEHLYQFTHSAGSLRAKHSFLQLVWLLCAWIIWNDSNNRLFKNVETSIAQQFDKVKHYSLWWLKAINANFVYDSSPWWSSPLSCLGIG